MVAALGDLRLLPEQLEVARGHRLAELQHLHAEVVHVELALDRVARRFQQARERVAHGGPPPVSEVHRPGRVRADELDLDLLRLGRARAAPGVTGLLDLTNQTGQPVVGQTDVDEPGAGDLDTGDVLGGLRIERFDDRIGDVARLHLGLLRDLERDARRPVAVLLARGPLHLERGDRKRRQIAGSLSPFHGGANERRELRLDHGQLDGKTVSPARTFSTVWSRSTGSNGLVM